MKTLIDKRGGISFSIIESEIPLTLTKTIYLDQKAVISKPIANLTKGKSSRVKVKNISEFAKILKRLKTNQALTFGVTDEALKDLVTNDEWRLLGKPDNPIPRTDAHFNYPYESAAILVIDYDPPKDNSLVLGREELIDVLSLVIPNFKSIAFVWWASSSSYIFNTDTGEELSSLKGQRFYIPVFDGKDIPRAGKVIFDRLFLSGKGRYEISRSGQILERSVIDASVWQPNKLDFAGGAYCLPPLKQNRGEPFVNDGSFLDTKLLILDLSSEEAKKLNGIKLQEKKKVIPEQSLIKQSYIKDRLNQLRLKNENTPEYLGAVITRALENQELMGDFLVTLDDLQEVLVSELLNNPQKYHGRITKDPLEPEYDGYKNVGKLYLLGGIPTLHSFAHGVRKYKLIPGLKKVKISKGSLAEASDAVIKLMKIQSDLFDRSGDLVKVIDGSVVLLDEHSLGFWLSGFIQFFVSKKNNKGELVENLIDPPPRLLKQIMSLGRARGLKKLKGVISLPVITPNGRVINSPGFDEETGLYLDIPEKISIDLSIDFEKIRESIALLMKPFNSFPFKTKLDKTAVFAAVITAIVRPVLNTAPAFAFDAPVQGAGKTKLARCIALLCNGEDDLTITPHTTSRDDEEIRKRLLSLLRNGKNYVIWDNVLGVFDSASVAGLLTSDKFSDRALGKNTLLEYDNKALFLITGNNLQLAGDMPRRVITCRIDPETEKPYAREFDFDPEEFIKKHRLKMAIAVIQIISAFFQHRSNSSKAPGRMASFEQWDDVVRQAINWINDEVVPGDFGDVMNIVDNSYQNDPELEMHSELLISLEKAFESSSFKAVDILNHFKPELLDAREILEGWCHSKHLNSRSIGRALKFRQGKIVNGRRLISFKAGGSLSYKVDVA